VHAITLNSILIGPHFLLGRQVCDGSEGQVDWESKHDKGREGDKDVVGGRVKLQLQCGVSCPENMNMLCR
jgi:hypothetical protein